jgi:hypothetical protein
MMLACPKWVSEMNQIATSHHSCLKKSNLTKPYPDSPDLTAPLPTSPSLTTAHLTKAHQISADLGTKSTNENLT